MSDANTVFEDADKAVLYTGDIRSEPWFVNNLTRNPFLIEYTSGIKTLDCIYLDTSNLGPTVFPTKADGLKELLEKVSKYPKDTVFHFIAWTFGYEEVWMALSKALKSPIHVDKYKLRLYRSLRGDFVNKNQSFTGPLAHEGPALVGYICGNAPQKGCLTSNTEVRLHSCENGMQCEKIDKNTVWIRPIIARTKDGVELAEIGVGGGGGDLTRGPEMELDEFVIEQLMEL
jgi:DNA cross-link repair 1C protein